MILQQVEYTVLHTPIALRASMAHHLEGFQQVAEVQQQRWWPVFSRRKEGQGFERQRQRDSQEVGLQLAWWLGGSLVSALSFVASITLLPGPFVWFCVFFCLLLFRWPSHNDTQDVIVHVIPIAGSDPTSLCFWFVLVLLWLCVFCLLGCFCFVAPHFSDEPLFTRFIGGEPPPSSLPPIASSPRARVRVWPGVALFTFVWQRYKGLKKKEEQRKQTNKSETVTLTCVLSGLVWLF